MQCMFINNIFSHCLKSIRALYRVSQKKSLGYVLLVVTTTGGWIGAVGRRAIMLSVVALILSQFACK